MLAGYDNLQASKDLNLSFESYLNERRRQNPKHHQDPNQILDTINS